MILGWGGGRRCTPPSQFPTPASMRLSADSLAEQCIHSCWAIFRNFSFFSISLFICLFIYSSIYLIFFLTAQHVKSLSRDKLASFSGTRMFCYLKIAGGNEFEEVAHLLSPTCGGRCYSHLTGMEAGVAGTQD